MPQTQIETTIRIEMIITNLVMAMGGWSQMHDLVVGAALAGHILNQGLEGHPAELARVAAKIITQHWKLDEVDELRIWRTVLVGCETAQDHDERQS